jgi:hypothetical protein
LCIVPHHNSLYFDLIVAETHFSIETDTIDLIANMNPTGSPENEAFFGFQRFMRKMQKEGKNSVGNWMKQKTKVRRKN